MDVWTTKKQYVPLQIFFSLAVTLKIRSRSQNSISSSSSSNDIFMQMC